MKNTDILMISGTKIDNTFPIGNFLIDGFSTSFRSSRDVNGGASSEGL